jgi:hypothetical protein
MKQYHYYINDSQFSFDFEAPLMVKEGEYFTIYDYSIELKEFFEIKIKVTEIKHDILVINCIGFTE